MDLSDFKIFPGAVIEVKDPKYIGRVKADSPGLFDSSVMSKEGMPWIYPLSMSGYQRFSKLSLGTKIWIITDKDYHEFWYWPMFELHESSKEIISSDESNYEEAEILLARNMGTNGVYIYYTPNDGIMIKESDNTLINLTADNKVIIKSGEGQVMIDKNEVFIGDTNTESMSRAVMGDKLADLLDSISKKFNQIGSMSTNPYALPTLGPIFTSIGTEIASKKESLLAKNVKIN